MGIGWKQKDRGPLDKWEGASGESCPKRKVVRGGGPATEELSTKYLGVWYAPQAQVLGMCLIPRACGVNPELVLLLLVSEAAPLPRSGTLPATEGHVACERPVGCAIPLLPRHKGPISPNRRNLTQGAFTP